MLTIDGITRRFGAKTAVDNVSLEIQRGAFVGIIGRSGAGKSTLLRMINRLQEPSAGRIVCEGRDVTGLTGSDLRDWRQSCAMIFQQFNLVGRLDVLTNVLMGRLNHVGQTRALLKLWSVEDKAIALSALEQFDIASLAAQRAESLSGGQQQRVAIVRALAMEPKLMLLDEITSALDPELVSEVLNIVRDLARQGMTMLLATHEMGFAREVASKICFLYEGVVHEEGPPDQLFGDPKQERTRAFLKRIIEAGRL